MKPGTIVRMSENYKQRMMCDCRLGSHVGPFDPEDPSDCWGCSHEHIAEFGDCIGEVIGPMFDDRDAPEVDVVWKPSDLRYGYHPNDLVEVSTYDPAQRALEKQASRDKDETDVVTGRKSLSDLKRENGAFSGLRVRIDLRSAK